jgi:hypothetical protein
MARDILDLSDRRFSYSASNVLKSCEKQYCFKYVLGVEKDTDIEDDAAALRFGKAFHTVCELTNHDVRKFNTSMLTKAAFDNCLNTEDTTKVYACLKSYFDLHSKSKLECVGIELEIGDENLVGYIDAVMADRNGNFWICDLKTSGLVVDTLFARLHKDPQLNLYCAFAEQVVEKINAASNRKLDIKKLQGCAYRVVAKPRTTPKTGESFEAYAARAAPEAYDVYIPIDKMDPESALREIRELQTKAKAITLDNSRCNRANCVQWQRPCDFFSQCHGATFTECKESAKVFTTKNQIDQTKG